MPGAVTVHAVFAGLQCWEHEEARSVALALELVCRLPVFQGDSGVGHDRGGGIGDGSLDAAGAGLGQQHLSGEHGANKADEETRVHGCSLTDRIWRQVYQTSFEVGSNRADWVKRESGSSGL